MYYDVKSSALYKKKKIQGSNLTIYDKIDVGDEDFWLTADEIEYLLNSGMNGLSVDGLKNRTRSKVLGQKICESLGYPVPSVFKKTKPKFYGQNIASYSLKANNFQIYNEDIEPERRYVVIDITPSLEVGNIVVIDGVDLANYDTTGVLTKKYQAILDPDHINRIGYPSKTLLEDSATIRRLIESFTGKKRIGLSPNTKPTLDSILSLDEIYNTLKPLVGQKFKDSGFDQERIRGESLHRKICELIGYKTFEDDGTYPDLKNQLLEIKLQTSRTIDLGLVTPESTSKLDIIKIGSDQISHNDVRYAVVDADIRNKEVVINNIYVVSGYNFFKIFKKMGGKGVNTKIQFNLPSSVFDKPNTSQTSLFNSDNND